MIWNTLATDNLPTIFLGYPFALDHVRPAVERAAQGLARVVVASDILRGMPLLEKIEQMMSEANLCLFDLTTHNPNVAAEFGIARGRRYAWAILYCTDETLNPKPGRESSVFSDVKGWDSILYGNENELETELRRLLPEYLANLAQVRTGGNIGATAHHSPPAPVATKKASQPLLRCLIKRFQPVDASDLSAAAFQDLERELLRQPTILEVVKNGREIAGLWFAVWLQVEVVEKPAKTSDWQFSMQGLNGITIPCEAVRKEWGAPNSWPKINYRTLEEIQTMFLQPAEIYNVLFYVVCRAFPSQYESNSFAVHFKDDNGNVTDCTVNK